MLRAVELLQEVSVLRVLGLLQGARLTRWSLRQRAPATDSALLFGPVEPDMAHVPRLLLLRTTLTAWMSISTRPHKSEPRRSQALLDTRFRQAGRRLLAHLMGVRVADANIRALQLSVVVLCVVNRLFLLLHLVAFLRIHCQSIIYNGCYIISIRPVKMMGSYLLEMATNQLLKSQVLCSRNVLNFYIRLSENQQTVIIFLRTKSVENRNLN